MKKPFVVAISGVAGSGKDSTIEKLWSMPQLFEIVVSYTDRPPRPGEVPDKNYHFISPEEFDQGIRAGEFIEWEASHGEHRYGRKKADFDRAFKTGKTVVMVLDVLGAQKFKKIFDLATIFIMPPSIEEAIERLKRRGAETPERIKKRIDRYSFEMSFRNKYDHTIINDKLEDAQKELVRIIKDEKEKREHRKKLKKIWTLFVLFALVVDLGFLLAFAAYQKKIVKKVATTAQPSTSTISTGAPNTEVPAVIAPTAPASTEVKKKIAAKPPSKSTADKIASTSTKNSDGTTTTAVSTGGSVSQTDLSRISNFNGTITTPLDVPFFDETGKYADLGSVLDSYLNSVLRWRNEITGLKNITVRNAGDTGWNAQYLGNYTSDGSGKIVSAEGSIIINSYYIENQYCTPSNTFTNCESEYAKLFLSHEYGHHYTLYHKWVDWNLPNGTRFPDSYYSTRPLSKSTTAMDYSLGWTNCEVEIIAEDYSYLYSGYGLQAMHTTYGYPSAATKTWLDNVGSSTQLPQQATVTNIAPVVAIASPADGATLASTVNFTADASDDVGVAKVSFYVDNQLLSSDTSAPYSASLNTISYSNGTHALKVIASDGTLTSEKIISVDFENSTVDQTKPTVNITTPTTNPYELTGTKLTVSVTATDNVKVDRIALYLDDTLQNTWNVSTMSLLISFQNISAGTHVLKFRAYDTAGNFSDASLSVIKSM